MPRGGRWKTGASASRAGYQAAYRAGVNKGAREMGGDKVDLPDPAPTKRPTELKMAADTQANPGMGSSRTYAKDPGRQTALGKDGAHVESAAQALPGIRDSVPDDAAKALSTQGAIPMPGLQKRGPGL
jgi:hypothetical protein